MTTQKLPHFLSRFLISLVLALRDTLANRGRRADLPRPTPPLSGKVLADGPRSRRHFRDSEHKRLAVKMDDGQRDEATQDFRVRVSSKREVSERLDRCKDLLRTAMDGQPEVDEDSKRVVVQELLAVSDGPTTTTTIGKLRTVFARRKRHFILFLNKSITFM